MIGESFDLRLGDCLDPVTGMASVGDKSVDHVLSDPPYSADLYSRTRTNKGTGLRPNGRPVCRSEGDDRTSALQLASLKIGAIDDIMAPVAEQFRRICKRWMVIFHDVEIAHLWRECLADEYIRLGL